MSVQSERLSELKIDKNVIAENGIESSEVSRGSGGTVRDEIVSCVTISSARSAIGKIVFAARKLPNWRIRQISRSGRRLSRSSDTAMQFPRTQEFLPADSLRSAISRVLRAEFSGIRNDSFSSCGVTVPRFSAVKDCSCPGNFAAR